MTLKPFRLFFITALAFTMVLSGCRKPGGETRHVYSGGSRVKVPAGAFFYGCAATDPLCQQDETNGGRGRLEIKIGEFFIDVREVTNEDYHKCVDAGACEDNAEGLCTVHSPNGLDTPADAAQLAPEIMGSKLPAVCVNRRMAEAYCKWAGGRLPVEKEWEKAARGGDGRMFPWGNGFPPRRANMGRVRCCSPDSRDGFTLAAPPGVFLYGASPFGALDMAGNVWEWTAGCYEDGRHDDFCGLAPVRGGSWRWTPNELRTTNRFGISPETRADDLGFRCAK